MFEPKCVLEGKSIDAPAEDFKRAEKVEQYRISEKAVYIPAGLRWSYVPICEIRSAEESHRVITAGKCVGIREKRPSLDLVTEGETFTLPLERQESLRKLLDRLK